MSNESRKKLAGRLFVVCLSCAAVGTVVAAFMLHPVCGVAILASLFWGVIQLLASMYKDLKTGKIEESSEESNA